MMMHPQQNLHITSNHTAYLIGRSTQLEHARELSDGAQLHEPVAIHRPAQIHIMHQVLWTEVVLTAYDDDT